LPRLRSGKKAGRLLGADVEIIPELLLAGFCRAICRCEGMYNFLGQASSRERWSKEVSEMKDPGRRKRFRRWTARRKTEAILRVLRGKSWAFVARELGVKASTLARP